MDVARDIAAGRNRENGFMGSNSDERLRGPGETSEGTSLAKEPQPTDHDIFVGQYPSAATAVSFSDQAIVSGTGAPAETSVGDKGPTDIAIADKEVVSFAAGAGLSSGPTTELKTEMLFAESFQGKDESPLIETILPSVHTQPFQGLLAEAEKLVQSARDPITAESAAIKEPVLTSIEPQVVPVALARIERVRRALFGSTKAEDKTIALPIEESKPLAG